MKYFEFIPNGIRKHYDWGYSEIYMPNPEDCFTLDEIDEVIKLLSSLPVASLSLKEQQLLTALVNKRKQRGVT